MTALEDIQSFPEKPRNVLERQFGISSAEAFFEQATRNADGVREALGVTAGELDSLRHTVEEFLAPEFVRQCRQPVRKHPRGVITKKKPTP
jgi:hypothetical protein